MIYSSWYDNPGMILIWVLLAAGLICLSAYLIHKNIKKHEKTEEVKKDEKEIVQEELARVLKPVEDEKTKKQMEEFDEKDKTQK